MNVKTIIIVLLIMQVSFVNAQNSIFEINAGIKLPKDSIKSEMLINSLNQFLISLRNENEKNKWVYNPQELETSILLDEIKGLEKSKKYNDDFFYKPYLTNIIVLKNNQYFVQISYIGVKENIPYLRINCEFIAHKVDSIFQFSSPLTGNTKDWKTKQIENITFHYRSSMNFKEAEEFQKLTFFMMKN